jgi:ribosome-associated translation inhibitor RaiA
MQVQVNSNHTIHTGESFERWAGAELHASLSRFKDDITRIEVHMSDENGDKTSADHKRCLMEARLAHHEPLAVNHHAPSQDEAFRGASDKLKRMLDHTLGKLRKHRARDSIRHEALVPAAGQPAAGEAG